MLTQVSFGDTSFVYRSMQTSIVLSSILTTIEHPEQQHSALCNRCVHISIHHIQMYVKYRSSHAHTSKFWWHIIHLKSMQTSIVLSSILTTIEHPEQQHSALCNRCVHISIHHIQMYVKYRSSHSHTSKFWWHLIRLQRYANINSFEQYFDNNTAPRAATISIMKQLRTLFNSAHSDVCQIPI